MIIQNRSDYTRTEIHTEQNQWLTQKEWDQKRICDYTEGRLWDTHRTESVITQRKGCEMHPENNQWLHRGKTEIHTEQNQWLTEKNQWLYRTESVITQMEGCENRTESVITQNRTVITKRKDWDTHRTESVIDEIHTEQNQWLYRTESVITQMERLWDDYTQNRISDYTEQNHWLHSGKTEIHRTETVITQREDWDTNRTESVIYTEQNQWLHRGKAVRSHRTESVVTQWLNRTESVINRQNLWLHRGRLWDTHRTESVITQRKDWDTHRNRISD